MFDEEQFAFTHNNSPSQRLSDLSPIQFFELTHNSFLPNSPVKFREEIAIGVYNQIPFLNLIKAFLNVILQDGFIQQTPTGRIQVKILARIYAEKHLTDEFIERGINKLSSEDYWPTIVAVKTVCKKAGITRIEKNKIVLVKKNIAFLDPENIDPLFKAIYLAYSEEINWAYFDGYLNFPIGQYGVNFSIYLLMKYGKEFHEDLYYSERYLKGYPNFSQEFNEDFSLKDFQHCYSLRTFDRFTNLFGLTQTKEFGLLKKEVIATDLLYKIFKLEV